MAIALVALVVVVAIGFFVLRFTGAFTITNVSVVGVEHLTDAEVSALAQVEDGATLLNVDTAAIRNRLLADTWIQDAQVNCVFPDTLQIVVTERQIAAVVDVLSKDNKTTRQWAIAKDGMWLMPIPDRDSEAGKNTSEKVYQDADSVLHITDVPYSTNPEIGSVCTDANVNNALSIVSSMTTELADQVKSVSATDAESTTLTLKNGVEVAFGSATDIRTKERVVLQILQEHEGTVAYINVRTVNSPTWRAL